MKRFIAPVLGFIIMTTTAHAQQPNPEGRRFSPDQVRSVAPALEHYTDAATASGVDDSMTIHI